MDLRVDNLNLLCILLIVYLTYCVSVFLLQTKTKLNCPGPINNLAREGLINDQNVMFELIGLD